MIVIYVVKHYTKGINIYMEMKKKLILYDYFALLK